MQRRKKIIIFYEHINRELYVALSLKKKLEEFLSVKVYVLSIVFEYFKALFIKADLVIMPWMYDHIDFYYYCYIFKIKNPKMKILNLHHEQIGTKETIKFLLPKDKISKQVYHLAWGQDFAQKLLTIGVEREKIFITGNPRTDEFFNCNDDKKKKELAIKYGLDFKKKWILFADNLAGIANLTDDEVNNLTKRGLNFYQYRKIARETYSETIKFINNLALNLSQEFEIIFRFHPGHNDNRNLFNLNIKIINDLSIYDWFPCINVFLTWNSTSVFEAILCGVENVFRFEPFTIPEEFKIEKMKNIPVVTSAEQLIFLLQNRAEFNLEIVKKECEEVYGPVDGMCCNRIVDIIKKIIYSDEETLHNEKIQVKRILSAVKIGIYQWLAYLFVLTNTIDLIKWPIPQYKLKNDFPR